MLVPGLRAAGDPPVPVIVPDLPEKLAWTSVNGVKEFHLHCMSVKREFPPGALSAARRLSKVSTFRVARISPDCADSPNFLARSTLTIIHGGAVMRWWSGRSRVHDTVSLDRGYGRAGECDPIA